MDLKALLMLLHALRPKGSIYSLLPKIGARGREVAPGVSAANELLANASKPAAKEGLATLPSAGVRRIPGVSATKKRFGGEPPLFMEEYPSHVTGGMPTEIPIGTASNKGLSPGGVEAIMKDVGMGRPNALEFEEFLSRIRQLY